MSLDATRWAWKQRCKKSIDKLVLLSMADRADENHCCFPSIKRLEIDTEANRKTIIAAISRLIKLSLIVDTNERKGITKKVKVYRLIGVINRGQNEVVPKTEPLANKGAGEVAAIDVSEGRNTNSPENGIICGKVVNSAKNGTIRTVPKTGLFPLLIVPKKGLLDGLIVPFLPCNSPKNGTQNLSKNQQIDRYRKISEIHKKLATFGINEKWLIRQADRRVMTDWISKGISEEVLTEALQRASYSKPGESFGVFYLNPIIMQLIFTRDNPGDIRGTDKPGSKSIQELNEEGAEAFLSGGEQASENVFDVPRVHG